MLFVLFRFVVVAQSRYLWRLMLHRREDFTVLILPGVAKETMSIIVRFLYTGDLFVHQEQLNEVRQLLEDVLQLDTRINFPESFAAGVNQDEVEEEEDDGGVQTDEECADDEDSHQNHEEAAETGRRITRSRGRRRRSRQTRSRLRNRRRGAHNSPGKCLDDAEIDIKHESFPSNVNGSRSRENVAAKETLANSDQEIAEDLNGSGESVQLMQDPDPLNMSKDDFPPKKRYKNYQAIPSPVNCLIQDDDEAPIETDAGGNNKDTSKTIDMTEPSMQEIISSANAITNSEGVAEYQDKDVPTVVINDATEEHASQANDAESTTNKTVEERKSNAKRSTAKPKSRKRRKSACPKKRASDGSDKPDHRISDEEMDRQVIDAFDWRCSDPMLDEDKKVHMRTQVRAQKLSDEDIAASSLANDDDHSVSPKKLRLRKEQSPAKGSKRKAKSRQRRLEEASIKSFFMSTRSKPGEHWMTADSLDEKDRDGIIVPAKKSLPPTDEDLILDGSAKGTVMYQDQMVTEEEMAKLIAAKEKNNTAAKKKKNSRNHLGGNSRWTCEHCGKRSNSNASYEKHQLTHKPKDQWPYECPLCLRTFQAKNDVYKHLRTRMHVDDNVPETGTPDWEELMLKATRFPWPPKEGQKNHTSSFTSETIQEEHNLIQLNPNADNPDMATMGYSENFSGDGTTNGQDSAFSHHSIFGHTGDTYVQESAKSAEDGLNGGKATSHEADTQNLELATTPAPELSQSFYSVENPLGEGCSKDVMFPST